VRGGVHHRHGHRRPGHHAGRVVEPLPQVLTDFLPTLSFHNSACQKYTSNVISFLPQGRKFVQALRLFWVVLPRNKALVLCIWPQNLALSGMYDGMRVVHRCPSTPWKFL
jgi:hypothetical protein